MSSSTAVPLSLVSAVAGPIYEYVKGSMKYQKPKQSAVMAKKRAYQRKRKQLYKKRAGAKRNFSRSRGTGYKKLRKQVTALSRSLKSDQARHTWRQRETLAIGGLRREVKVATFGTFSVSTIETASTNLRYYDPSVPGTLVTAAAGTGTYERKLHVASMYDKVYIRNNYQTPCKVRLYLCTPKADTNISPGAAFTQGLSDQTIGPILETNPLIYPTDIIQLTERWHLKMKVKETILDAGKEIKVGEAWSPFDYDPAVFDHHNSSYQMKYRSHLWMVRVEGVVSHSGTGDILTNPGQVDCCVDRKVVFTYDAGVNLDDYSAVDSSDTSASALYVSSKPVADNIEFMAT